MSTSKTNTSDLFNRYIWLASTVYSAGHISYEEIARKWERSSLNDLRADFPIRTFHNHRKAIEELFDISIECDKRNGYKYYIENRDDIKEGSLRRWMLNTLAVRNLVAESRTMRERILLEEIPSGMNFLTILIEAMRDNVIVEITYHSFSEDREHTLLLEAYCLKLFHQRWYVLGRKIETDQLRVYALDRVLDCRLTQNTFRFPQDFDAEVCFNEFYGIYINRDVPLETVRIKVRGVSCKYLHSLPLHHTQKEKSIAADVCEFEYLLRPTPDFISELVSMGGCVQVLAPQWLADNVKAEIRKLSENAAQQI